MITIAPAADSDAATVAALWNAKRLDAESCWHQAEVVEAAYIRQLMLAGFEFSLALADQTPVGFGFWRGPAASARLLAVAGDTDEVYYRLLLAYCQWALALGAARGSAEIGTGTTTELGRMNALGVIDYVPIGFAPLAPGQSLAQRVPTLLRAECDLEVLSAAIHEVLEPTP